ncbi:MAG TPA: DUF1905 domain-containing protein [Candidatus Paceibacterota bacterium]
MGARETYKLRSKVVIWPVDQGAWHFVHLDAKKSEEIKRKHGMVKRGFGSIPVMATIGQTTWQTSIFPDKRSGTYLLPLKVKVRQAEGIAADDTVSFFITIRDQGKMEK